MTYCVGILVAEGLTMASDSRSNAGVDRVATIRKMTVFERPRDRVLVVLTAGNLSISQSVVSLLSRWVDDDDTRHSLYHATSMFDAARLVGAALREVHRVDGQHLRQHNLEFNAEMILGGQIKGESPRLFQLYAPGNFIEATPDTPYFQIGEVKYGKPIIDRMVTMETGLLPAAKCALISFDSTMRSNISVGLPIDLLCYRRDSLRVGLHKRLDAGEAYLGELQRAWGEGLQRVFAEIADPDWRF